MPGPERARSMTLELTAKELSPSTWPDFVKLFERHGGVWGGCWCMYYHVTNGWSGRSPQQNKEEKETLVKQARSRGVLMYHKADPIGWCQFGPREELPRVGTMKDYKVPASEDCWRITCFFVDRRHRRRGVAREALRAAIRLIRAQGAELVEAYPIDVRQKKYSSSRLWFGSLRLFEEFGFTKVGRLGKNQWIVRKQL